MHLRRERIPHDGDFAYELLVLLLERGGGKEEMGDGITRKKWKLPHATPQKMYDVVYRRGKKKSDFSREQRSR